MVKNNFKDITERINREIENVLEDIDEEKTKKLVDRIIKAKRIFLAGSGRSKLVAEAFGMRLVQLGIESYVIGESTTPALKRNDLLIAISGSGETKFTKMIVNDAKKIKLNIYAITSNEKSSIAKSSSLIIKINAKTKSNKKQSLEPMGSLFEQSAFIYLDSVVLVLMKRLGKKEKFLKKRHSRIN